MKTVILGLDALPYWYITKLREWGQTPRLTGILDNAAKLESIPPITAASWPSIMTGVNPGKHGIFSFFSIDRKTRRRRLVTALDLEHPRIHEMLAFNKVKTLAVNPVPTYPLIPVRYSRIVSNILFTPEPVSNPQGLHERYFSNVSFDKASTSVVEFASSYAEALRSLIEEEDGHEFAWITMNFPDAAFHKHPRLLEEPAYAARAWKSIDKLVKTLLDKYENVFIVSDHGFRSFGYRVSINDILYKHGYARPAREDKELTLVEAVARLQGEETVWLRIPAGAYRLLARLGLEAYARRLYPYIARIVEAVIGKKPVIRAGESIDYESGRAVMPEGGVYGVYIFDPNTSPQEIAGVLKGYRGLRIWLASEVYNGPYMWRGPDVVVIGDHEEGYALAPARIFGTIYIRTHYNNHDLWGVLAARTSTGIENMLKGEILPNNVVAPLVMCLMRQPVPAQADSLDHTRRFCPYNFEVKDYTGKFRIVKKLAFSRARHASGQVAA